MERRFEVLFLNEVFVFLHSIERKHYEKILFNIRKVQVEPDPALFKKLRDEIWEFRTLFQGTQYRLLAFWDKEGKGNAMVVVTQAFIKKRDQIPGSELKRAIQLRKNYFFEKANRR
jgi:hypothetical protein